MSLLDKLISAGKYVLQQTTENRQAMQTGTTPETRNKIKNDKEYRDKAEKATIAGILLGVGSAAYPAVHGAIAATTSPILKAVGTGLAGAEEGVILGALPGLSTGSAIKDALYGALGEGVIPAVGQTVKYITGGIKKAKADKIINNAIKKVSNEIANKKLSTEPILNIGWAPKTEIKVSHASDSPLDLQLFNKGRYDVKNEGANPFGIWYQGKLGIPRTVENGATLQKAKKAAKARELFANRPYIHEGSLTLEKPIVTIGDVPNRSNLSYNAERAGADGIIYNNVYDNGYDSNQVILSFKKIKK